MFVAALIAIAKVLFNVENKQSKESKNMTSQYLLKEGIHK